MKKGGILNPAICSLLAELGQSDELLIVDAAYPAADRRPRHRPDPDPGHSPPARRLASRHRRARDRRRSPSPSRSRNSARGSTRRSSRSSAKPTSTRSRSTNSRNRRSTSRESSARPSSARTRACASWPEAPSDRRSGFSLTFSVSEIATRNCLLLGSEREVRGGHRKPDSVEPLIGRFRVPAEARMIIFLGRRLPGASSDLPGSRNGSGRSVCSQAATRHGEPLRLADRSCTAPLFGLAPDGVYRARPVTRPAGELLPHRFTLTAAATQAPRPRRFIFCGTVPIRAARRDPRTVGVTHHRALWSPDFPPRHVLRRELSGRFPSPC